MKLTTFLMLSCLSVFLVFCSITKRGKVKYPDCSSTDIELVDTCLLGKTIRQVFEILKLDTSQVYTMQEPLAVIRGISYMPDSNSRVELFVERTPIRAKLDSIVRTNGYRIPVKYFYYFVMDKSILTVKWEKELGARGKTLTLEK